MSRPMLVIVLVLMAGALLACGGLEWVVEFAFFVVMGWAFFLGRVVPQVRVGWSAVATALACLALFAVGLHAFLAWLYRQVEAAEIPRRWHVRWTAAAVGVVVAVFVAGLATVGAAHQVGMLLTSKEPLFGGGHHTAARRSQSVNNLKQIGLGLHNYHSANEETLPGPTFDREGRPLHGFLTYLLPYVEQNDLYNAMNLSLPWDDPRNAAPFRTVVNEYINPGFSRTVEKDAAGYAPADYAENARMVGVRSLKDVKDGTSQTILAGEVAAGSRPWGDPVNWRDPALGINRAPDGFGGPFKNGASLLMVDGSVRFVKDSVDPKILKALGTPAGDESVAPGDY